MHLGICIEEEALHKRLVKWIAESIVDNNLEKELTASEEYENSICRMRTGVRIGLASPLCSTEWWSSSTQVHTARHHNYEFQHRDALAAFPVATVLTSKPLL